MQRRRRRGLGPSHPLHPALSDLPCLCSALGAEGLHHQDVQREDLDEPLQFPQLSDGPSASQPPPPSSGLPLCVSLARQEVQTQVLRNLGL